MGMVIAVDAAPLARSAPTGGDVYARELIPRLPAAGPEFDWTFYAPAPADAPGMDLTVLPFPALRTQLRLPWELTRSRPDLLFSPASGLPVWCPVPALTVVHGLESRRHPEAYPLPLRLYLDASVRLALWHSKRLLTVSDSTGRDLAELYGVNPDRVRVVYPGPGTFVGAPRETAPLPHEVTKPFVLNVGRIEPRKNQLTLLRAVEQIPGLQLVCVGPRADGEMARRLSESRRCLLLDWVGPEIRDALYRECAAFVFPTLYEGFGFPVLEAMGCGAPVIVSRNSSLPEVAGDAALYVDDPRDADALCTVLQQLLNDDRLRAQLVQAGSRQVMRFSWESCAAQTVDAIREVLGAATRLGAPADGHDR